MHAVSTVPAVTVSGRCVRAGNRHPTGSRALVRVQARATQGKVHAAPRPRGEDAETKIEDSRLGRRAALGSAFVALGGAALGLNVPLPASADDVLLYDFVADTKDMISQMRALLREGNGDIQKYLSKSDAYFSGYKWDHAGHTNSFSQLLNIDVLIKEQQAYFEATGGKWSPDTIPPSGSPKANVLEGYLQNAERCVLKEGFPKFGKMTEEQKVEWKAITCTQGLVAPAET